MIGISQAMVASILRKRGLFAEMTPYGFPLTGKFRLERGSGIAGRENVWAITHIQTGERWRPCETTRQLSAQLDGLLKEPKLGIYRGRVRNTLRKERLRYEERLRCEVEGK
jgi:hypothetical protein